ncbi:MAG TPA: hypothetical protein VFG23_24560 [Polyangia bacterium]|nr:hypothetical protein [Polyangia bacterium]
MATDNEDGDAPAGDSPPPMTKKVDFGNPPAMTTTSPTPAQP